MSIASMDDRHAALATELAECKEQRDDYSASWLEVLKTLEKLTPELAECKARLAAYAELQRLIDENPEGTTLAMVFGLLKRLAEAERDTERLDWMEQPMGQFYNIDRIASIVGKGFAALNGGWHPKLRAAIDATRDPLTTRPADNSSA